MATATAAAGLLQVRQRWVPLLPLPAVSLACLHKRSAGSKRRQRGQPTPHRTPRPAQIERVPCLSDNYSWLLHEPSTGVTAVVDPAEVGPVVAALRDNGWSLTHVLNSEWEQLAGRPAGQVVPPCLPLAGSGPPHRAHRALPASCHAVLHRLQPGSVCGRVHWMQLHWLQAPRPRLLSVQPTTTTITWEATKL